MAEVTGVDVRNRRVLVNYLGQTDTPFEYDYLILATGASHSYFGHNEFAPFAPGMKTLADVESVRAKVLKAFETAEIEKDPSKLQDLLTFVLVGAGPTGVEMAGSLAELRRFTMSPISAGSTRYGRALSSQKQARESWRIFPKSFPATPKLGWRASVQKYGSASQSD
jgi:NADH dehydrogenase FAD-containing subunit